MHKLVRLNYESYTFKYELFAYIYAIIIKNTLRLDEVLNRGATVKFPRLGLLYINSTSFRSSKFETPKFT